MIRRYKEENIEINGICFDLKCGEAWADDRSEGSPHIFKISSPDGEAIIPDGKQEP